MFREGKIVVQNHTARKKTSELKFELRSVYLQSFCDFHCSKPLSTLASEWKRTWAMARQRFWQKEETCLDLPHPKICPVCPGSPRLLVFSFLMVSKSLSPLVKQNLLPSGGKGQCMGKHAGLRIKRLWHLLSVWPWVGGLPSVSLDSSLVKCMRIHLGRKSQVKHHEPKRAFTGSYFLGNPKGRPSFSLRGRSINRKRKHGCIFPNSAAQLHLPRWLLFLLPLIEWTCLFPGGTGNSSTMNASVSDRPGLVTWLLWELEVKLVPEPS